MSSFRCHCTYSLIIAALTALCLYQAWRLDGKCPAGRETSLHELVLQLHKGGVDLRAVSQRKDGLLLGAMFLTETDQGLPELRRLALDERNVEMWNGTVLVLDDSDSDFACSTSGWGENGMRRGPFLFFGDKALLEKIRRALDSSQCPLLP